MKVRQTRFPSHVAAADPAFASVPLLARRGVARPSADGEPGFLLIVWEALKALLSESFDRIEAV